LAAAGGAENFEHAARESHPIRERESEIFRIILKNFDLYESGVYTMSMTRARGLVA